MYTRNQTRVISIGDVKIGGGNPVAIQSMTNTKTENVEETVKQILALEKAGCQIIRCTVPTMKAAQAFTEIKKQIHIPLVADIHFDYKLAIAAMEHGADKIRINPGNIGGEENIRKVVETAKKYHVPIRVGVNSGSLEKPLVKKYNGVTAQGLVESALDKVAMLEKYDLHGMTKKEIISLLGDETQDAYFKEDNNMVYWLGPERGLISIDSEWLVIVFENGIVADYYITCD